MGAPRTARAARADDTRKRIFAAAAELFAVRGFHETTVDEIAKRAGVAKGTFFVHFATKDAVVAELVRRQVRLAGGAREGAADPVAALRAVIMTLGEQAGSSRALSRAVLAATLENPKIGGDVIFGEIHKQLAEDARQAQEQGLLSTDVEPKTIASALSAAYLGAAVVFMATGKSRPLMDVLAPLVDACLAGFATKARKK
jgi:AcrR family transcriptional regulator